MLSKFKSITLFEGLNETEIKSVLNCLDFKIKNVVKNTTIYEQGAKIEHIGIILSGEVEITKTDLNGNKNIISRAFANDLILANAAYSNAVFPFSVESVSEVSILLIKSYKLINKCNNNCCFHQKLISNLLNIMSKKNLELSTKINVLTQRNIKEKILAYLESQRKNSSKITIHLSRQQLADYLSVDRSALSRELSKMKKEGIISIDKNIFYLKNPY